MENSLLSLVETLDSNMSLGINVDSAKKNTMLGNRMEFFVFFNWGAFLEEYLQLDLICNL